MSDQDFIGIDITGATDAIRKLQHLPQEAIYAGMQAANEYMLPVLRTYQPYRYVSRKAAYGQTFFSDRQRRYVMAKLRREGRFTFDSKGNITSYKNAPRTQNLSHGWRIIGQGANALLVNEVPYAKYVQGPQADQSRHERKVGWKWLERQLAERMPRIIRAAEAAINKVIRRLGL